MTSSDLGFNLGGVGSVLFKRTRRRTRCLLDDHPPWPQSPGRFQPVRRAFPTAWFNPFILRVSAQNGVISILQAIPLTGTDAFGARIPVTGLPNDPTAVTSPANPLPLRDERPFTCATTAGTAASPSRKFSTPFAGDHDGHDTEDIVRDVDGNFSTIEEYGPSISRIDPTGRVLKRFVPAGRGALSGDHFTVVDNLPQILGRRPRNRGFEGSRHHARSENPHWPSSKAPHQSHHAGNPSRVIRLIAFDIETESPVGEYVYVMQSVDEFAPSPANPTEMKISAISALDQHRFLVDERTDLVAKLFVVDIRQATNILGTTWDTLPAKNTTLTLEELAQYIPASASTPSSTTDTLFANGIVELPKESVADLSKLRNPDGTPFNTPQKIEGLTVLDGKTIAISNDDDFRVVNGSNSPVVDATCTPSTGGVDSQIVIVRLDKPIK